MKEELPYVSIIVPVLNRENTIGKCIESLLELDYPFYETIIIDGGSTDKTMDVVSKYPVKVIIDRRRGAYAARNSGLQAAQGDLIFFTDSDCISNRDVLRKLARHLTDEKIAGVGGQISSYNPATIIERFSNYAHIVTFNLPKGIVIWNENKLLSGGIYTANALYRKSVLEEVNGFDVDFVVGGDYDLSWRLQRVGYRIVFDPGAVVFHKHRTALGDLIKQFFNYGIEHPLLLKKQPGGFSHIEVKSYFLPPKEFRRKLPVRMLVCIDFCNLSILGLLLSLLYPILFYPSLLVFLAVLVGAMRKGLEIKKESGEMRWLLFYPLLHFIRNGAWTIGKICGGIKHRLIAF